MRPDGHPLLKDLQRFHVRGPAEKLFEEAYDWAGPLTDAECTKRHLVGIDVNMAFAAGANGLLVGLSGPTYVETLCVRPEAARGVAGRPVPSKRDVADDDVVVTAQVNHVQEVVQVQRKGGAGGDLREVGVASLGLIWAMAGW